VCVRTVDTIARLGGDEFVILLDDINDIKDATQVADRIQTELSLPFKLNGHEVFISTSIGIALSTTPYENAEEILRDADTVMYRAKALGKARYEVFDQDMHTRVVELLQLENDLRRSLERQELEIYYQPIVCLTTGRINGFEALLRWQHPQRGLVSPADFIPIAEETGLIVPIGYWVLREACHQVSIWQQRFDTNSPLTISVNVSGKQFSQPDLIKQIDQILQETNFNAHNLKLEITESVLIENSDSAAGMLVQLKKLGIQVYIDDFGTGYSSLSYLHRFPIDALKIDRSFVSRINIDFKKYVTNTIGEPTLRDIINELEKPGRDPRAQFKYATFKEGIKEIKDLKIGMELEGIITNVANFGAFVDIGVHQDGLVHISQLADRFVADPKQVVKVGQVVKVRVLEVNEKLKRISLSMKAK
jgi:predicted signal transduction protein with EAL and GGDEF domain